MLVSRVFLFNKIRQVFSANDMTLSTQAKLHCEFKRTTEGKKKLDHNCTRSNDIESFKLYK